ncbi:MAG: hypothetical protein B6I17_02800 [Tenericutes bacterium 4572_104]|nr:MAG: hypothetical protein B6I17_02800 [Tenericutes bacterium 4572_104]
MFQINNLKLSLDEAINKEAELLNLYNLICQKYHLTKNDIFDLKIIKKAVDARRGNVHFVYNVKVNITKKLNQLIKYNPNIKLAKDNVYKEVQKGSLDLKHRPVIIGFGPSGIFAGLILAKQGYKPLILERGYDIDTRTKKWKEFLNTRKFNENGSVLFGEGGAGTFSDGKLTTLVNDIRSNFILQTFVDCGADQEIKYINHPHIGTDKLATIIKKIRYLIESYGGEIRFGHKVTDFIIKENKIKQLIVNDSLTIDTIVVLLGIGHSARDTFKKLYSKNVPLSQKPFSIGLRIEHPQDLINKSQYGKYANHKALGPAEYKLSYHAKSGRTAYTFCMCPGGYVVPTISEPNQVCTNGMSFNKRDNYLANSALLVNVVPDDFPTKQVLSGIEFQRQIEEKAFKFAGLNYNAPVQLLKDFMLDKKTQKLGKIKPTYKPGYSFVKLDEILPEFVIETIKEAIPYFDKRIHGFSMDDAVLTGPETRSSSPVRINRNLEHESSILGLYPMGEGAGYAGGIMSSAIDGIKTAEKIIMKYKSFENS